MLPGNLNTESASGCCWCFRCCSGCFQLDPVFDGQLFLPHRVSQQNVHNYKRQASRSRTCTLAFSKCFFSINLLGVVFLQTGTGRQLAAALAMGVWHREGRQQDQQSIWGLTYIEHFCVLEVARGLEARPLPSPSPG